uniref:Uncharacterized protein n=1 Tax=Quercus lobata TaxID=97700 RepID=A0A7N2LCP5_QUELO
MLAYDMSWDAEDRVILGCISRPFELSLHVLDNGSPQRGPWALMETAIMDTNQPRPVTPQPPQGGGGSGFSAILTVFLSFISIFAMGQELLFPV